MRIVGLLMMMTVPGTGVALLAWGFITEPSMRLPIAVMCGICAIGGLGAFIVSRS